MRILTSSSRCSCCVVAAYKEIVREEGRDTRLTSFSTFASNPQFFLFRI